MIYNNKYIFNENKEIRRLEKAARDKDKNKLIEWGMQFENQIRDEYDKEYDRAFKEDFANVVDTFCLAITYTLHFNEKTKFGKERTINFLNDLLVTVDLIRKRRNIFFRR